MPATFALTLRPRLARLVVCCALLALAACQHAAPPAPAAQPAAPAAADTKTGEGGKCYQGCVTWGESCNADPRGVYKCQRRCEKFGEICE